MPSETSPHPHAADGLRLDLPLIDGVSPDRIVAPGSPEEVADILAEAADRSLAVAPIGGGTALGLGNVPERLDLAVSTERLNGVLDYEPMDLVLSVGAGARFSAVQAILAEHGQGIPLEAPLDADATIGGLIATALAGPRRLGSGSLRDLLIGISVAHPSGTVTKAGGMVVKNVTGFDLTRMYLGSLGTLGVIVSANFKVLPRPRSEATLLLRVPTFESGAVAASAIRASSIQPVALELTQAGTDWRLAVRIEGRETTVTAAACRLLELVKLESERLDGPESTAWWRSYVDAQAPSAQSVREVVVRCGVRPRGTVDLLQKALDLVNARSLSATYIAASLGLGSLLLRLEASETITGSLLVELQHDLQAVADTVSILAADPAAKRSVDVWGKAPGTLDVMQSLKDQFDPAHVLNPGRFAGRI
jgi:glycolate oxidase FAD binding subunit